MWSIRWVVALVSVASLIVTVSPKLAAQQDASGQPSTAVVPQSTSETEAEATLPEVQPSPGQTPGPLVLPGQPLVPGQAADAGASAAAPTEPPALSPELQQLADEAVEVFKQKREELEDAVMQMREAYVRYVNVDESAPRDRGAYWKSRDLTRQKMDEAYEAAMELIRYVPDQEAAQYVITMVQYRNRLNIYNRSTAEGAARMIDAGVSLLYLFQAAARSAVVSGEFEMARRLFEAIEPDLLEDVDRGLMFDLDEFEKNYLAEQKIRERELVEDRLPRVKVETTRGDFVVELFLDNAPSTVANFIQLVEQGFYDGLDFHQVVDNLLALTGDPSGVGSGGSGRSLIDEHERPDARKAFRGSLVMAKLPIGETGRFVPDSASSQFAILYLPLVRLTEYQTVFGRVIEGMDVVSSLRRVDPTKEKKKNQIVLPPDRILKATVIRRPETLPEPVYSN